MLDFFLQTKILVRVYHPTAEQLNEFYNIVDEDWFDGKNFFSFNLWDKIPCYLYHLDRGLCYSTSHDRQWLTLNTFIRECRSKITEDDITKILGD